jgi:hypothetical protein
MEINESSRWKLPKLGSGFQISERSRHRNFTSQFGFLEIL